MSIESYRAAQKITQVLLSHSYKVVVLYSRAGDPPLDPQSHMINPIAVYHYLRGKLEGVEYIGIMKKCAEGGLPD